MSDIEYEFTREPICPACGHRHRDAWEWGFDDALEGHTTHECDSCGAEFECDRIVTVDYSTRLVAATKDQAP